MKSGKVAVVILLVMVMASALAACGRQAAVTTPLNIGLLPVEDSLPFYVAADKGYFQQQGVTVNLQTYRSAVERDAALQAGAIDGYMGDIIAAAQLAQSGLDVKIISVVLGATPAQGRVAILSSPKSNITTVSQLKGVPIAISRNSLMDYVVDRLLRSQGFGTQDIATTLIAAIPERLQALMSGQVQAAALPDPVATLAQRQGAHLVIDDTHGENLSQTIVLMRADAIANKKEAIVRMLRAYNQAVQDINRDPNAYRSLLVDKGALPAELANSYQVEQYPLAAPPTPDMVNPVLEWMRGRGLIGSSITYDMLVDTEFATK